MNYSRIYFDIINKRKFDHVSGYAELHHILPRSLGGSDDKENLVRLTAREHFVCHYLLSKMYKRGSAEWFKMQRAFNMMNTSSTTHKNQRYINSRLFEAKRKDIAEAMSIAQSGKGNSQYGKTWITNGVDVKKFPIEDLDSIPNGWYNRRLRNYRKQRENFFKKCRKLQAKRKNYLPGRNDLSKAQLKKIEFLKELRKMYNVYVECGFDGVVDQFDYRYSKPNLVTHFSKNIPEFVPQNGKKRIKNPA